MPSPDRWATWATEVGERLETIEPLVSPEWSRATADGRREVLAWQGQPLVEAGCSPTGELELRGVEVEAFQLLDLPRQLDSEDFESGDILAEQIATLLERVRAALYA